MKKILFVLTLVMIVALSACTRQVSWVGMNYGNQYTATYELFDGKQKETIQLTAGETLTLTYDVEVKKGSLTLQFEDSDREIVWAETFLESAEDVYSYTAETSGRYTLTVIGDQTGGGFDLSWEITD